MERRYYLRGLGLGIAVTTIIMSVALTDNQTMTNDEIIARAKELGLVENTVLSNTDNADDSQESEADDPIDAGYAADQAQNGLTTDTSVIDTDSEPENAETKEDEDVTDETEGESASEADNAGREEAEAEDHNESENAVGEEAQDNETDPAPDASETEKVNETVKSATAKVITINNGDSSYTVAKKLADVGAVASAQDFDTFLCRNGYDKRLRTGSFTIPANAGDVQIARIVTGLE